MRPEPLIAGRLYYLTHKKADNMKPNYLKWINSRPQVRTKDKRIKYLEKRVKQAKADKKKALKVAASQYKKKYAAAKKTTRRKKR